VVSHIEVDAVLTKDLLSAPPFGRGTLRKAFELDGRELGGVQGGALPDPSDVPNGLSRYSFRDDATAYDEFDTGALDKANGLVSITAAPGAAVLTSCNACIAASLLE
jgi:hypothetical protein